ncbi:hypothetical protein RSSM_04102 [Rhodopirellula sallentina SM41]|uniref:Uncharacterized protein n=1 Tax=Rhodopirellula sallentina SM41 TaxID=1263870 RepID=M5TZ12_9BACT|nr:hypothetical protein RSSM_04102 [Rhodopirellula sallentina SM41]
MMTYFMAILRRFDLKKVQEASRRVSWKGGKSERAGKTVTGDGTRATGKTQPSWRNRMDAMIGRGCGEKPQRRGVKRGEMPHGRHTDFSRPSVSQENFCP